MEAKIKCKYITLSYFILKKAIKRIATLLVPIQEIQLENLIALGK